MQANNARINAINQLARKLLDEGHPDSDLIRAKQQVFKNTKPVITLCLKLVNERWQELTILAQQRKEKLSGSHEVQKFNRAIEEAGAWVNEKAVAAMSADYGRDLASVQALQRKHEGLERDLDALDIKVSLV